MQCPTRAVPYLFVSELLTPPHLAYLMALIVPARRTIAAIVLPLTPYALAAPFPFLFRLLVHAVGAVLAVVRIHHRPGRADVAAAGHADHVVLDQRRLEPGGAADGGHLARALHAGAADAVALHRAVHAGRPYFSPFFFPRLLQPTRRQRVLHLDRVDVRAAGVLIHVAGYLGGHDGHRFGLHHRQQRRLVGLVVRGAHEVALDDRALVVVVLRRERVRRWRRRRVLRALE